MRLESKKRMLGVAKVAAAVVGGVVINAATQISTLGDGAEIPKVILNIAPADTSADPGPKSLLGDDAQKGGTQFAWADLSIEGDGNCRVYFDYKNPENFHYLDRRGAKATLGICEAGIEEPFASGTVGSAPLRIARHGSHMALFQNGKLICSAFDERIVGGAAGFRMLTASPAIKLKAEPREDVHFSDDFMVTEERSAQWRGNGSKEKGNFGVYSLKNPLLSANAFCYMGKGKDVYSVVGQPWWDLYTYSAAVRGPVDGQIGLVFAFQDDQNYGLFRWTAQKTVPGATADAPATRQPGVRELVRIRDGKEEVLQSSVGGYEPAQWYGASIRMAYGRATVTVDSHVVLDASDPFLSCGGAGVWCNVALPQVMALEPKAEAYQYNSLNELMKQHAVFDDVKVDTFEGIQEDFRTAGPLSGGWLVGNGEWRVQPVAVVKNDAAKNAVGTDDTAAAVIPGELIALPPATGLTKALIGDRRWSQYQLDVDVTQGSGATGVVFLHRDESNFYTAVLEGDELKISRTASGAGGGKPAVVDSAKIARTDGPVHLTAAVRRGHIKVSASAKGATLGSVETFDTSPQLRGRVGLIAGVGPSSGLTARFERFNLSFIHDSEPLITTNAVFEDELTMNDWTNPTSEWHPPKEPFMVDGKPVNLLWHRSQFPGDVEISVEPRDVPEANYEVALSLGKSGTGKNNGYIFRYKSGDAAEGASRTTSVEIYRQGEKVTENVLNDDSKQLSSLSFRRCGKYVVGMANGQPILSFRDENPLNGSQIAYYTKGVSLRTEATKITSNNFRDELFSSAPAAWRTAGDATIAEVTNRWQCDPRWSFYSLKSEVGKAKAAVLWNKTLFTGDATVELFVGNKMEGERGPPYTYARDINVTICSDGSDLTKGYTFCFGGNGNTGSYITRNGVEVKRSAKTVTIPTDMNFHRHWYAVKVEKHGNRLSFRVDKYFADEKNDKGDNVGELVYEDPQPLTGNRIGVWTYNHAIMISRVRISGEGGDLVEEPGVEIPKLKSPYDGK